MMATVQSNVEHKGDEPFCTPTYINEQLDCFRKQATSFKQFPTDPRYPRRNIFVEQQY